MISAEKNSIPNKHEEEIINDSPEQFDSGEYFEKLDKEFGLASDILAKYYKSIGQETTPEEVITKWQQELIDTRAQYQEVPISNPEQDIADLKDLLTLKLKEAMLAEDATRDSVHASRKALLAMGCDEDIKKTHKPDNEVDQEDILDVAVNENRKELYYQELKNYLKSKGNYYLYNHKDCQDLTYYNDFDADTIEVYRKLDVMEEFYKKRDYYNFSSLPASVADEMLEHGASSDAYYSQIFPKFESLSNNFLKDMFPRDVTGTLKKFEKFTEADPIKLLERAALTIEPSGGYLLKNFVDKNIHDEVALAKAYDLMLKSGNNWSDQNINPEMSAETQETYKQKRDKLTNDLETAIPYGQGRQIDEKKTFELIKSGYAMAAMDRLPYEQRWLLDRDKLREELAKQNKTCLLLQRNYRSEVRPEDYVQMINEGNADILASHLKHLHIPASEKAAELLIKEGYHELVFENLGKFSDLGSKFLDVLVDKDKIYLAAKNIRSFDLEPAQVDFIIENEFPTFANNIPTKFIIEKGYLDSFIKSGLKNPVSLMDNISHDPNLLTKEDQTIVINKLINNGLGKEALVKLYFILENVDVSFPGPDFDGAIEDGRENIDQHLFQKVKNLPADSFYVQNFDKLQIGQNNNHNLKLFIDLYKKGEISRTQEHLDIFCESLNQLGNQVDDKKFFTLFLKRALNLSPDKRTELLQEIKNQAKTMAENIPQDPDSPNYEASLRLVYPERNYNAYENLDKVADRSTDLQDLKFNRAGEKITVDGLTGYKLKEGEVVNQELLTEYSQRIADIKAIASESQLEKFLDEKLSDSQRTTLEGKILDYLDKNGYDSNTMNVVMAYQLIDSYDQFVAASTDRVKESEDQDTKNYVMLDELLERYGDNLKETIKKIQNGVQNSLDSDLLRPEQDASAFQKFQTLGAKIMADLKQIPREKLSDSVIRKKVKKSLENTFQGNEFINANSTEFAADFSEAEFDNFATTWGKISSELAPAIGKQSQLVNLEKAQSKIYQEIQQEATKYEEVFEVDSDRSEKKMKKEREIHAHFSKNKENFLARMVGDVCLAPNQDMWNEKEYFELVLFDEERSRCVGTTMLKTLNEPDGKKFLLFAPNPSVGLVSEVSAKKLYNKIKDLVNNFAQANNYDGVVFDKTHGKATNRAGLFQKTLETSGIKNENQEEIIINLKQEHKLSSYGYKENLRATYLKE